MNQGLTNAKNAPRRPILAAEASRRGEEGYMLLAVICLLALLIISMSIALPKISKEIQRDREVETMHRGKQYVRAIKMYYKKFSAFPPNMDVLVKPNGVSNLRFLRKKYVDPTTGKNEWKVIHFGEAKTQTLGFFGQPIGGAGMAGGSVMAGVGPNSGGGMAGAQTLGGGLTPSTDPGAAGTTDPSIGGSTPSAFGSPGGSASSPMGGQAFGGLGIIGFSPNSPKQSILVYKKKNHYNEWEFVYDPLTDMTGVGNSGPVGQPGAGGTGIAPGTGGLGGGGGGFGSSGGGFGNSGGFGSGSGGLGGSGGSPTPPPPSPPNN